MERRATVMRIAMVALATATLVGCGRLGGAGSGGDGIAHPTGAAEPVIVVRDEGGFVMPQWTIVRTPTFALYGDGTAITLGPQIEIYPSPLLPPLFSQSITEVGIQALLGAARDAGLFQDRTLDDFCGVADVATTVIEIHTDDATYRTSVYGLGFDNCKDDPEARAAILTFVSRLTSLEGLPDGSVGAPTPYVGDGWVLAVGPYMGDPTLPQTPVDWPIDAPTPADANDGCLTVVGDAAEGLRAAFEGANQATPWVVGDTQWSVLVRPLYPDETDGCAPDGGA